MDSLASIPSCYHPTTVVVVDDNQKYLVGLHLELDALNASYKLFDEPSKALHYLKDEYQPDPFINRCLKEDPAHEHRIVDANLHLIHHELFNQNRFNEIGAVVIDCVMPGLNGLEICQRLKDKPFKKILLTGEAQEQSAIHGFNRGDIHQYVKKDEIDFKKVINETIAKSQWQYFLVLSSVVTNHISDNLPSLKILNDRIFIDLFNSLRKKTKNIEFYLLDKQGSFLLLDIQGNPSWLIVKNEKEMHNLYTYANDEDAPISVQDALKNRTMIPYFHTLEDQQTLPENWDKFMHPAIELKGDGQTYYYAFISNTDLYKLNKNNVLTFQSYLNTL